MGQLSLLGWAFAAGSRIVSDDPKKIRLPLPARIILSLSLVFAAFLVSLALRSSAGYLILGGMILSFLGDMFNAGVIPLPVPLVGGMISFGAAHGFYIAAFHYLLKLEGALHSALFWTITALVWLITAISWLLFVRNPGRIAALNTGSLIYALLIGAMFSFSLLLGWEYGGRWWIIPLGALLFYISDTIIGLTDIGRVAIKKPHLWIWMTYILGQMGIVYGVWMGFTM